MHDGFDPAEALHLMMGGEQEQLGAAAKKAADIFACGVLIFWALTGGRHPFGEEPAQRRSNILRGGAVGLAQLRRLPEALSLVSLMVGLDPNTRLQADQARQHPVLWSDDRKLLLVRPHRPFTPHLITAPPHCTSSPHRPTTPPHRPSSSPHPILSTSSPPPLHTIPPHRTYPPHLPTPRPFLRCRCAVCLMSQSSLTRNPVSCLALKSRWVVVQYLQEGRLVVY